MRMRQKRITAVLLLLILSVTLCGCGLSKRSLKIGVVISDDLNDTYRQSCITSIGDNAFYDCSGLTGDLIIPNSVTSIGSYAFYNCRGLNGTLKLSENLTTIYDGTFLGCSGISGELVIPDSVKTIYYKAFESMSNITSVVLGEGVAEIGTRYNSTEYCPFNGCTGIKEVTFKGTAVPTRYPADIFYSMDALETVYVPAESYSAYVNALNPYKNNAIITSDYLGASVKGLEATSRFNNTIALSWKPHISDDVIGYVVTRDGVEIARTTECRYVDADLASDEYTYTVYGYTADGSTTMLRATRAFP